MALGGAADGASGDVLEVAVKVRCGELDGRERSGVEGVLRALLATPVAR